MPNAIPIATLCLADPVCLSGATACLSSLVAIARRLQSMESVSRSRRSWLRSTRSVFVGATYAGAASFAICFSGVDLCPNHLATVASVTVLASIALDWSSELAARLLRAALTTMARTYLREIVRDEEDRTSRPTPSSKIEPPGDP